MLRRAQQSGQNPNDYVKHMVEHNHIPEMVSEVVRGKALALLVTQAVVTDASGNPVELRYLREDGTIADPEEEAAQAAESGAGVTFEGDTFFAGDAGDSGDADDDAADAGDAVAVADAGEAEAAAADDEGEPAPQV